MKRYTVEGHSKKKDVSSFEQIQHDTGRDESEDYKSSKKYNNVI